MQTSVDRQNVPSTLEIISVENVITDFKQGCVTLALGLRANNNAAIKRGFSRIAEHFCKFRDADLRIQTHRQIICQDMYDWLENAGVLPQPSGGYSVVGEHQSMIESRKFEEFAMLIEACDVDQRTRRSEYDSSGSAKPQQDRTEIKMTTRTQLSRYERLVDEVTQIKL